MATATNRRSIADYGPLEKYYKEIQKSEHPNHFTLAQYANPAKYCYGRNGEPCPFTPTAVQDPFLQLSNRSEHHHNGLKAVWFGAYGERKDLEA